MNNQDNNNDMGGKMMWIMILCCIVPITFIFLSGVIVSQGNWIAIVIMVFFVVGYLFLMYKFHNNYSKKLNKGKSNDSHNRKCH